MVFKKYACWDPARINQVIDVVALTFDRGTFLATHSPIMSIRRFDPGSTSKDINENEILFKYDEYHALLTYENQMNYFINVI